MMESREILDLLKQVDNLTVPDSRPRFEKISSSQSLENAINDPKNDTNVVIEIQYETPEITADDSHLEQYYESLQKQDLSKDITKRSLSDEENEEEEDDEDEEFVEA